MVARTFTEISTTNGLRDCSQSPGAGPRACTATPPPVACVLIPQDCACLVGGEKCDARGLARKGVARDRLAAEGVRGRPWW